MAGRATTAKGLAKIISSKHGMSMSEAKEIVNKVVTAVQEEAASNEGGVFLGTLGKFVFKNLAARTARNLHTGEPVEVPAKTVLKFKAK